MEEEKKEIIPRDSDYVMQLQSFEKGFLEVIQSYGLPSDNIFVSVPERAVVFRNVGVPLQQIDKDKRDESFYLTKFLAAVASGLFDAALNYLWDATIQEIRKRVIQYDVSYFYDNTTHEEKKKKTPWA